MYLTLEYLKNHILKDLDYKCFTCSEFYSYPSEITIFDKSTPPSVNSINIGYLSNLDIELFKSKSKLCIICISDVEPDVDFARICPSNICFVVVSNKTTIAGLYQLLCRPFAEIHKNLDEIIDFTVLASQSVPTSSLLEKASDILNCSIALLDPYFRVLEMSYINNFSSKDWDIMKSANYYPNTNIVSRIHPSMITIHDSKTGIITTTPESFPESGDAFLVLNSSTPSHTILGYLVIHYSNCVHFINTMELLHFIEASLSFRLWHTIKSAPSRKHPLARLIANILNNNSITDEEIHRQLANLSFIPHGSLRLIVIGTSYNNDDSISLTQLTTIFSALWPNAIVFPYEADIVALFSDIQEEDEAAFLNTLQKKMVEYDLYAGFSLPFTSIDKLIYNRYVRAKAACQISHHCRHSSRYMNYNNVAMLHYVHEGSHYKNQKSLVDPELIKMIESDKANGTEYVYTLKAFWFFNQNINQVCEYLHIHRNTLFYRLKKIKEFLGQDITLIQPSISLRLSISIMESIGEDDITYFPPFSSDYYTINNPM